MNKFFSFLLIVGLIGCEQDPLEPSSVTWARNRTKELAEIAKQPCRDKVTLVATTTGSPNYADCDHPQHKARVQVATKSGEEIGVTVYCECVKEDKEE